MEEGGCDDTESEDEPDLLGFVRALSLDQFSPSWFSSWSWTWNAEETEDGEDSETGEEEQNEESDHANDSS